MKPFEDIDAAREAVNAHDGRPEEFVLPVSDSLQDPMGLSMAIILDAVLARGWDVDGFEQHDGYRVYRYKSPD